MVFWCFNVIKGGDVWTEEVLIHINWMRVLVPCWEKRLSEYCVCTDLLFFVWLFSVSKDAS